MQQPKHASGIEMYLDHFCVLRNYLKGIAQKGKYGALYFTLILSNGVSKVFKRCSMLIQEDVNNYLQNICRSGWNFQTHEPQEKPCIKSNKSSHNIGKWSTLVSWDIHRTSHGISIHPAHYIQTLNENFNLQIVKLEDALLPSNSYWSSVKTREKELPDSDYGQYRSFIESCL